MTRTHELIATIRTWKDKQTGTSHKHTLAIGAVFVSPKGAQVLRLDAWPTSPDFSGWVAMKPCAPPIMPKGRRASPGMPPAPPDPEPGAPDPDADKPF